MPEILHHAFLTDAGLIENLIDDRPLSETDPIRAYTDDERNYITWLIDAAQTSLDALREEQGFSGGNSPQTLLYLYLRHALLLGYYDTSYELHRSAGFLSATDLAGDEARAAVRPRRRDRRREREPVRRAVQDRAADHPQPDAARRRLHHPAAWRASRRPRDSTDQLQALGALADAPTAQLERAFAEHVDTCSYRFDAWLLGTRRRQLRADASHCGRSRRLGGIYLGAYAWVEDLRPSHAQLVPAQVPRELGPTFARRRATRARPEQRRLPARALTHARAHRRSAAQRLPRQRDPRQPATHWRSTCPPIGCASRSRSWKGIRNGQSLGALLGYRFERGLHDDYGLAEVDKFIYPLRKAFPLVADSLASTATPPDVPIEAIEARNVLDGRKLVDQIRDSGVGELPVRRSPACPPPPPPRPARSTPRRTPCWTSTTRSQTSHSPRACTRRCRATSTGSPPRSTPTRPATSRPTRKSCRRRLRASA